MKKILGLTLVAILGCGGDKNTTDTDGGSSGDSAGDASGTTGTSVTSTTGPTSGSATDNSGTGSGGATEAGSSGAVSVTDGTGGGQTTADGTTGGEATGGGTTGGGTTGGGADVMAECQAVCDAANACMLDAGPDCVAGCLGEFDGAVGECKAAIDGYLMCLASMSCMELTDLFNNDNPGPCADEVAAADMACGMGGDCTTGVGSNPAGTECSLTTECPNQPTLEMQCAKAECVCLVDGMEVATCPSDMICKTVDQLEAKATDCCGF